MSRDDRIQVFLPLDNIVADRTYGGIERSDALVIEAAGVRGDDLMVSLVEVTKENWSLGGGRATYA